MNNPADIAKLIARYHNGELDARAMHELERDALNDPFLAEALEGYRRVQQPQDASLQKLQQRLNQRITTGGSAKQRSLWPMLAVAASVLIAVAAVSFWLLRGPADKQLVANKVEMEPAPAKPAPAFSDTNTIGSREYNVIGESPVIASGPRGTKREKATAPSGINSVVAIDADDILADKVVVEKNDQAKSDSLQEMVANEFFEQRAAKKPDTNNVDKVLAGRVAGVKVSGYKTVTGRVIDAEGNIPLPGVAVQTPNNKPLTQTNGSGYFQVTVPDTTQQLRLGFIGYENQKIKLNKLDTLLIAMQPSHASLNEVVVVTYGNRKKVKDPYPVGGWEAFNNYLKEDAVTDDKTGTVKLSFAVDNKGELKDFKILKSTDTTLNAAAIDLIKDGPNWVPASTTKRVTVTINFRKEE